MFMYFKCIKHVSVSKGMGEIWHPLGELNAYLFIFNEKNKRIQAVLLNIL